MHPIETKIIFESQIKESTYIEENILKDLNERQKKAIEHIKIKGRITTKEYVIINNVSERTARNDLDEMVKKGVIISVGETNQREYKLRQNFGKR